MLRICSRALVKVGMMKPCHLVKPVSVRNLSQLKELPKQPVPPLQQSCELYLSNLEPILEEDELKRAKELVEEFQKAGGVGERLQRCLERKARNTDNWMADDYVRIYYMLRRRSLVGFSNPGGTFPRMDFRDKKGQIRCAAKLITAAVEFKTKIDNDTLPVEYMRGKPMCMKQYKQLMSSCRIPGLKEDSLEFYTDKHIVVVRNCQFFALDVYNSDGSLLTEDQLCVQLERICDLSAQTDAEPVGILTTEHRDLWSKTYMNLNRDETNRQSTSAIERSIFLLCLDGSLAPVPEEMYQTSALNYMVHGGGSQLCSGNRWFDKGVQLIVAEDGTVGMNLSNASADGIIMMSLSQYLIEDLKKPRLTQSRMEPLPVPQKLHFNLTPEIKKDIEDAKQHLDKLVEDLDMSFTVFEHYGKNLIRSHKMSPDAFVQMALLLAYYRKYQKNDALMEPVSLRTFREGRLSLMIVNTPASAAFVKAFDDPQKQNSEKLDLLEKALETHAKNTDMALRGHDVFGHFWGLRLQAVKENIPVPELFTDNTFHEVFKYKLAGSHIVNKAGTIPAFGPEEPGQYDVVYGILNDHIHFVVASVKSARCKENNAAEMARAMDDALLDMRTLLEQTRGAEL